MHAIKPSRRHLVGVASLTCSIAFAGLSFAGLPAAAQTMPAAGATTSCPVLSVGNPNPADNLTEGGYIISGTAYDPAATSGSGVSRVDFFLGDRDSGGIALGSAVPGETGTNPRAFSVEVQIPDMTRGVDFAAYATSSITGQQTEVSFPVLVGPEPAKNPVATPTPIPTTVTVTSTCPRVETAASGTAVPATGVAAAAPVMGVPTPMAMTTGAATTSGTSSTTTASMANACPILSLGNPGPADNLLPGGLVISGTAYDPAATSGSGVSRVDLFLGERDSGGTPLGSAVPGDAGTNPKAFSIEVQVPNINRGVDFAAYAISSISGQETQITFPVLVGTPAKDTAATPTPIPATETVTNTCTNH